MRRSRKHLPLLRRQLAESLPQLEAPLGRHHAVAAIDVDEPGALGGRQTTKLLIPLRARPRVARRSCRARTRNDPAPERDRAGSSRANVPRRARSAADAAARAATSSARAERAAAAAPRSSPATRYLARAPRSSRARTTRCRSQRAYSLSSSSPFSVSGPADPRLAPWLRPSATPRSRATRRPLRPKCRDTRENPSPGPAPRARLAAPRVPVSHQQPSASRAERTLRISRHYRPHRNSGCSSSQP